MGHDELENVQLRKTLRGKIMERRYHFMITMKDAYGDTIVQMMDFKGARTVKFQIKRFGPGG
jgi:hypothetical protein